jgi:hypothetical protein
LGRNLGGHARRIGQKDHRPALAAESRKRLGGGRMVAGAVMDHPPDVADQRVMAGRDFGKTGNKAGNGHAGPV